MYKVFILVCLVSLCGCNSTMQTKEDVHMGNANQHIAMAAIVANFYCQYSRWPNNLEELEVFERKNELPLPERINWTFIRHDQTIFKITDVVYLRIPENIVEAGDFAVSSTSKVPKCEGKNIVTDFHMNLGD